MGINKTAYQYAPIFFSLLLCALPFLAVAQAENPVALRAYSPTLPIVSDGTFEFTPTKESAKIVGEYKHIPCGNSATGHGKGPHKIIVRKARQVGSAFDVSIEMKTNIGPNTEHSGRLIKGHKHVVPGEANDVFWPDVLKYSWQADQFRTVNGSRVPVVVEFGLFWPANGLVYHAGEGVDLYFSFLITPIADEPSSMCFKKNGGGSGY